MSLRSMNARRRVGLVAALILIPLAALFLVPGLLPANAEDGPAPAPAAKKPVEKVAPSVPKAPDLLAKMIPSDAVALIYAPNVETLLGKVRALVARADEQAASGITTAEMFQGSGIPVEHIDATRPFALAVTFMENGEPAPTFIVPCSDANAAKQQMGERAPALAVGDYLALGMAGQPSLGENRSPMVDGLPGADVTVRINFVKVMEAMGDQINGAMDELSGAGGSGPNAGGGMPGMPPQLQDMVTGFVDGVKTFLNASERLDITASIEGGELQLGGHLLVKAGSSLVSKDTDASANLLAMGSFLPTGAPLSGLMNFDASAFTEFFKTVMDAAVEQLPEEERADAKKYFDETMAIMTEIGPGYAFTLSMPKSGMAVTQICDAKDPAGYITRAKALFENKYMQKSGMKLKAASTIPVAGIEVHKFDLAIDAKAMMAGPAGQNNAGAQEMDEVMGKAMQAFFGGEHMTMYVAAVENKLVYHIGTDVAEITRIIEAMSKGVRGTTPPRLAQAIRRTGGHPVFLVDVEIRTLAKQVMSAIAAAAPENSNMSMPELPDGDPIRGLIFATSKGRDHRGGLHLDVGSLIDMIVDAQQPSGPRNK